VLAAGTAGYSAYLFGQAEGRDFWQSPLLLPQLLVAAVVAGVASLVIVTAVAHLVTPDGRFLTAMLAGGLVAQGLVLVAELFGSHSNADTAQAARLITHGPFSGRFWSWVMIAGVLVPLAVLALGSGAAFLAAVFALAGLWVYEDLWLKAGQSVPLS
jgi:Ni/Fe-hydrogenase subunit HybB-like protein